MMLVSILLYYNILISNLLVDQNGLLLNVLNNFLNLLLIELIEEN